MTTQTEEYLVALQRERAEFLNFKRRTAEERQRDLGLAAEDLIRKVLTLADDFDLAIEARPESIAGDPWVRGRQRYRSQAAHLARQRGRNGHRRRPRASPFDPREHDHAIAAVPARASASRSSNRYGAAMGYAVTRIARRWWVMFAAGNGTTTDTTNPLANWAENEGAPGRPMGRVRIGMDYWHDELGSGRDGGRRADRDRVPARAIRTISGVIAFTRRPASASDANWPQNAGR